MSSGGTSAAFDSPKELWDMHGKSQKVKTDTSKDTKRSESSSSSSSSSFSSSMYSSISASCSSHISSNLSMTFSTLSIKNNQSDESTHMHSLGENSKGASILKRRKFKYSLSCSQHQTFTVRGDSLRQQGKYEDAKIYLERSIQLDKDNSFAHASLGDVLRLQGNYKSAKLHLEAALRLNPQETFAKITLEKIQKDELGQKPEEKKQG